MPEAINIEVTQALTPVTVNITTGIPGMGVPQGGTTGQLLAKASNPDNDTEWVDPAAGGGGGVTDHGALSGLSDDDHPQYLNNVRGDARYPQILHTHDDRYYTEAETDTLLSGKAAATHSHAIADVTGLQSALDGKQPSGSYAAATHSHAISDVTGLQTALDGKAPSSHTHTASQITDFAAAVSANTDVAGNTSARHSHSNKSILDSIQEALTTLLKSAYDSAVTWISTNGTNLVNHLSNTSNPHTVTKSQVGLGNADNTSDANKPISNATQTALNAKQATLTTTHSAQSGTVAMPSAATWYTGTSISLTAGTYLISGQINVSVASGSAVPEGRITDGTTVYSSNMGQPPAVGSRHMPISLAPVPVVLSGSATLSIQGYLNTINATINGSTPSGQANVTYITAVKIA